MNSKSEMVRDFMERIVSDAINSSIADNPTHADALRSMKGSVVNNAKYRACRTYSLMELNDIMHWKKPKRID